MTLPAARVSDNHICPMITGIVPHVGGPIMVPMPTVFIGKMPAATATAMSMCVGAPDMITKGSTKVLVGKKPQARLMDTLSHGGMIVMGCPTVLVGG